jgi:hypothetical protein
MFPTYGPGAGGGEPIQVAATTAFYQPAGDA